MTSKLEERARELRELASQLNRVAGELEAADAATSSVIQFKRPTSRVEALEQWKRRNWSQSHYLARRLRDRFFDADLFRDPAWDILLDLYIASGTGVAISVTSACVASASPTTTALRWLGILEARGLVERYPSTEDHRIFWVKLSEAGHRQMTAYTRAALGTSGEIQLQREPAEGGTLMDEANGCD